MHISRNAQKGFSETGLILALVLSLITSAVVLKLIYSFFSDQQPEDVPKEPSKLIYVNRAVTKKMISIGSEKVMVIEGTGYPTADRDGIGKAIQTISGFTPSYSAQEVVYNFSSGKVDNCNVTYNHITGKVSLTTKGC